MSERDQISWKQISRAYFVLFLILAAVPAALLFTSGIVNRHWSDLVGLALVGCLVAAGSLLEAFAGWFRDRYVQSNIELDQRLKLWATAGLCIVSLFTTAALVVTSVKINF